MKQAVQSGARQVMAMGMVAMGMVGQALAACLPGQEQVAMGRVRRLRLRVLLLC